jgi:hypothetical protein
MNKNKNKKQEQTANGNPSYHGCPVRDQQISVDVCIVAQGRHPNKCRVKQCSKYRGGGK